MTEFQEKIKYLKEQLNLPPREFTELFMEEIIADEEKKKDYYNNRRRVVMTNWHDHGIEKPKSFHFEQYPISKLKVGDELSFTRDSFMVESVEDFKKRVNNYIRNEPSQKNKFDFDYKYIYYFDISSKQITFVTIDIIDEIEPSKKYNIKLNPPDIYINVKYYKGTLEIIKDNYYFYLENNFEKLSFYFVLNRGYATNNILYGLRLGLSYDKSLPISAKNFLTKEILEESELDILYMSANESEYLIADESHSDTYNNIKTTYINKLQTKIENLSIFTKKSKHFFKDTIFKNTIYKNTIFDDTYKDIIFNDIYIDIFYQSLLSINEMSKKVTQDKTYFVSSREKATNIFLKGISLQENKKNAYCNIVYPIFNRHSSLFDEKSRTEYEHDIKLNISLAKGGLTINRILIVTLDYEISDYFKQIVNEMIDSGINILIAIKEEIQNITASYDFIYNKELKIAGYRNAEERKCYFKISKDPDKLKNLSLSFDKIKEKSYDLKTFLNKQKEHNNIKNIPDNLLGKWNLYMYGSSSSHFWHKTIEIDKYGKVTQYVDDNLTSRGNIETYRNTNQYYIYLDNHKGMDLIIIFIDKRDVENSLFTVSIIDNEWGKSHNKMASFGIFSKSILEEKTVIDILGEDKSETLLIENDGFKNRVAKLLREQESSKKN